MPSSFKEALADIVKDMKMPKYNEIPSVGLYLEQTAKYISEDCYFGEVQLTGSMISNYVKKGLIENPVKKQYSREQIGYLIFITMAKSIMSIEDIKLLIEMQKNSYPPETAYNYFAQEFENAVQYVFGLKNEMDSVGENNREEKTMLRNVVIAVAYQTYINSFFKYYREKGN